MQSVVTNAIDVNAAKDQHLTEVNHDVNEMLERADHDIAIACEASNTAEVKRGEADAATKTEKASFQTLAEKFYGWGMVLAWYFLTGNYKETAQDIRNAIARHLWANQPELLALYLTQDSEAIKALSKEQVAKRDVCRDRMKGLIYIMTEYHKYLDNREDMKQDYGLYEANWDEQYNAADDPKQFAKDHPLEQFGEGRWKDDPDSVAAYIATRDRNSSGVVAPLKDMLSHLASIYKTASEDVLFTDNVDADLQSNVVGGIANLRTFVEYCLPDGKKDNAITNLLDKLPE